MKKNTIKTFFKNKKVITNILKYSIFGIFVLIFSIFVIFVYYTWDLPKPETFTETPFIQSTKIFDSTGKVLLYDIFGEEKREIVPLNRISENLKNAIITSEDSRFYKHQGIDFKGILRSILVDLKLRSKSQGGSTITQQLVRSVYLTRQKIFSRKVKEIVLSIELESKYSKDQILEWYLNRIPFGSNAYGAEAASQTFFDKPSSDLSIAESATLASLIPAPSYYSPYGPNKEETLKRKDSILEKMEKLGYITKEQLDSAKKETLSFSKNKEPIKAPDLVFYIKKYLDKKYGEEYLKEKGLRVYSTLDWELQQHVEKVVKEAEEFNTSRGAHNTAVVVLNPKNGHILSLMGSKDYFADPYPEKGSVLFNPKYDVATMAIRQPGSAFKPIVYATAFKKGFTPDTVLWDVQTEFNPSCDPRGNFNIGTNGTQCYNPQNYDGLFRGPVTLRKSLGCSLNIPAVKILYLAGIKDVLETAKDFGITTLNDTNNYGLSLVLGGGAVNLLELTSAYGVFASEGNYLPSIAILKITDAEGNILEENKPQPTKVLDIQIARQINSMLSDNEARAPIFGYNSPLYIPGYQIAAKTGTTENLVDAWAMGYTPSAVVGLWAGNSDNSPTNDSGVGIAAPMWNKIMTKITQLYPKENFTQPELITNRPPILLGQVPEGENHTILYYIDKNNPLEQRSTPPESDPQYFLWQTGINNWLSIFYPTTQQTTKEIQERPL